MLKHIYCICISILLVSLQLHGMESNDSKNAESLVVFSQFIPAIARHLDLATTSCLLRSCTICYESQQGIPESWCTAPSKVGADNIKSLQFGVSRLLQHYPQLCAQLQPYEHANALVHYAQAENKSMIQCVLDNENDENMALRLGVLEYFKCDTDNFDSMINAYTSVARKDDIAEDNTNEYLARIFTLNSCDKTDDLCSNIFTFLIKKDFTHLLPLALKKTKGDINTPDSQGFPPLIVATKKRSLDLVKQLIEWSADIHCQYTKNGSQPIHCAAESGWLDGVQFCIDNNVDINTVNNQNVTPLISASWGGYQKVVKLLLDNGADTNVQNSKGATALIFAAHKDHEKIVNLLLANGADANIQNTNGYTALINASENGHEKIVNLLLANGADIDMQNNRGNTPLWIAYNKNHKNIMGLLLTNGANPNVKDKYGKTILMNASYNGQEEVVKLLLMHGADIHIETSKGFVAYQYASHKSIKRLLENANKKEEKECCVIL